MSEISDHEAEGAMRYVGARQSQPQVVTDAGLEALNASTNASAEARPLLVSGDDTFPELCGSIHARIDSLQKKYEKAVAERDDARKFLEAAERRIESLQGEIDLWARYYVVYPPLAKYLQERSHSFRDKMIVVVVILAIISSVPMLMGWKPW